MITRRLLVSGKVQGVFYRAWTERTARELRLRGWVKNLPGGEVEILAQGPAGVIEEFAKRCSVGPPAARVDNVEVVESKEEVGDGFVVRAGF